MKTLLAIVLAATALTIGAATVAPIEHRRCGRGRTRQVVWGRRVPTEADTVRDLSWAVSCPLTMEVRDAAIHNELDER